ncbi:MAG: UDP-N-acetylmuramoyl-L-alanyl-D-glutamate--2,6-diaminopimelate ligase [Ideonella sp.]|nr:UDP-N-acetylmuramoyl-L-alanyl-D-glutamate--2,6-diaminopimelate ligase [Ideonella sp.]
MSTAGLASIDTPAEAARWLRAAGAVALVTDHRQAAPGHAFLAWPGARHDARRHVAEALRAGSPACLVEADGAADAMEPALTAAPYAARIATCRQLKARAGAIAHEALGRPSERLHVVASTGTNGKTSTTWWIAEALAALGTRCGVVGTLGIGEPSRGLANAALTTPDAVRLHTAFAGFLRDGVTASAIEASSIGLAEHRLEGVRIEVAVFTNLTQDHLDYHGSMEAYWAAKRRLFDWPGLRAAVVNVDDPHGARLAAELAVRDDLELWTVGQGVGHGGPRLSATDVRHGDGLAFTLREDGRGAAPVVAPVVGHFNVHNLLAVAGALRALGVDLPAVAQALGAVRPVPGRMQRIDDHDAGPAVVVDYAHTPDAVDQVLAALRPLARGRGGRLWCVIGCGGNRDAGKRPLMAASAEAGADRVVLTSDNPRDEPPHLILAQMATGLARPDEVAVVEDRHEAIAYAIEHATTADVVLVAGKGHEDYQEIAGRRVPFSDAAEARAALLRRTGGRA